MSLRHACLACGGSCQGVSVRATDAADAARVEAAAAALGVEQPWVAGALRRVDGRCVFQQDDALCSIHARLGPEHKPSVCRQYPYVHTRTEAGEERRGVDPGCYTWTRTWRTAEASFPAWAAITDAPLPPPGVAEEASFLDAAPTSMAAALAWMSPALTPDVVRADWWRVLRAAPLRPLLMQEDAGPSVRTELLGALDAAAARPEPGPWPGADVDEIVVEAVRRMLWLRLAPKYPARLLVHLLLGGGLLWAWADPQRPQILAAWCRAVRAPVFASRLVQAFTHRP